MNHHAIGKLGRICRCTVIVTLLFALLVGPTGCRGPDSRPLETTGPAMAPMLTYSYRSSAWRNNNAKRKAESGKRKTSAFRCRLSAFTLEAAEDQPAPAESECSQREAPADDAPAGWLGSNEVSPQTAKTGGSLRSTPATRPIEFGHALPRPGVQCDSLCRCRKPSWKAARPIPWQVFAHGEYVGPARLPHLPEYRLRVDDTVEFVFRLTGRTDSRPYRFDVGDTIRIESLTAENLDREVLVQPDGTITLRQLGQVPAAGRTVEELRTDLDERYQKFVREPNITVTPTRLNTTLQELRATVDSRAGAGGQSRRAKVTPEGSVQLPAIGSVPAHGLTLAELKREIEERYAKLVHGMEVTPILLGRAPRYVYVLGEVKQPGRFTLEGPTTLMQAIALAGSWNVGAQLREVIVFRRDDEWRLMATRLNIRGALYRKDPCPSDDIWLRDSDIVLVPKSPLLVTDEFIDLLFTRGIYGVVPFSTSLGFFKDLTTIGVL